MELAKSPEETEAELLDVIAETCRNMKLNWQVVKVDSPEMQGWCGMVWHWNGKEVENHMIRHRNGSPLYTDKNDLLTQMLSKAMEYVSRCN